MKTLQSRFVRIMMALLILASGFGFALTFGEQESQALNALPQSQVQRLVSDASRSQMVAALTAADGKSVELWRTSDSGRTWLTAGSLPVTQLSALAMAPTSDAAFAASGSRLFRADLNAQTWREVPLAWASVNAASAQVTSLAVDSLSDSLYIGANDGLFQLRGDTLTRAGDGLLDGALVSQVVVSRANPQAVYAASERGLFSVNVDGRWARVQSVSVPVHQLVETNGTLLAATGSNGLYRSLDGGRSWNNLLDAVGLQPGVILDVTALTIDPRDAGVVYAATGTWAGTSQMHFTPGAVYVSVDNGARWAAMSGSDGQPVQLTSRVTALLPRSDAHLSVQAVTAQGTLDLTYGDVSALLTQLSRGDAAQQAWAAVSLGLVGDRQAVAPLLARLGSEDAQVGLSAANALGRLGDASAIPVLIEYLRSGDEMVRMRAALALGLLKAEESVPALAAIVSADNSVARSTAAAALAQIGTPAAAEALVANLGDDELTARRQAAMAGLERMGAVALPALEQMAQDNPSAVQRRNAAEALGWIAAPQSVSTLAGIVRGDSAAAVRSEAAWALGEIGGAQARQALQVAQQSDSDATVRSASAQALARGEAIQARAAQSAVTAAGPSGLLAHLGDLLAPPRSLILLASMLLALAVLVMRPQALKPLKVGR